MCLAFAVVAFLAVEGSRDLGDGFIPAFLSFWAGWMAWSFK